MRTSNFKTAAIITIGNELTTGKVADSNASLIARMLVTRGYLVARISSIPDDGAAIISETRSALRSSSVVVVTGGLGPTHDDITKIALCELFKCSTRFNVKVLKSVQRFFHKTGKAMPEMNRSYAEVPTAAIAIPNRVGAAPGLFFRKRVLVMPGVPYEAREMLRHAARLIPHGGTHTSEMTFRTGGIGEVGLSREMTGLETALKHAEVAFLPSYGAVDIRITARGKTPERARKRLNAATRLIRPDIEEHIWGTGSSTIEEATGKLLERKRATLCVAESCTGGMVGKMITSVSGSSGYFVGGLIAYSNKVKMKELGVPKTTLLAHGAVSADTAVAMARGARRRFRTDFAVSVTGIAGPLGGTREKPVGLTFIAVSSATGVAVRSLNLAADRESNRERASFEALFLLFQVVSGRAMTATAP